MISYQVALNMYFMTCISYLRSTVHLLNTLVSVNESRWRARIKGERCRLSLN